MSRIESRSDQPPLDLWGKPVKPKLNHRTVVRHPQRAGWTILVRDLGGTAGRYVGFYTSKAEAWRNLHAGVALESQEPGEVLAVSVFLSATRTNSSCT